MRHREGTQDIGVGQPLRKQKAQTCFRGVGKARELEKQGGLRVCEGRDAKGKSKKKRKKEGI